ncbi:glycosyltransferase family 2 protein [Leifsonia sp. AG29]|uniref:glycosyltransferase family 2 protein n=1 Tax=Leifsonia sp. AG29 TaxID=2598860 RepID=UPI00131E0D53|nr:glycosyltransferase [Leifsonia sp. AG29]
MSILPPRALDGRPSVTVVIPHYNYGRYLPTAVASALDQQGVDVDVIIVDDRSTDGSLEVARGIAAENDRVTLVEHEVNLRHIRTYNDGLARATGDYVVLLSADDALTPDSLTRATALMEAHPRVGLVYGGVEYFHDEVPAVRSGRVWWRIWNGEDWLRRVVRRGRNSIVNPEVVLRRTVYERTGGYDPDFPHAADMYMWLQAASFADIGFVGGPRQACYRDHGENMHSTDFAGATDDMAQVRDVYERFFTREGARLRDAHALVEASRRSVAREALLRSALLESNGAPAAVLSALRDFARETSPRSVGSAAWRWADLASSDGARFDSARFVRLVEDVRWKIRSRRHTAVGL